MLLIKIGGGKQIQIDEISKDVATLISGGEQVLIVHGASETRDEVALKMGFQTKIIISPSGISSVYTDENAINVFLMTYAGLLNKRLVASLQKYAVNAVGLSGIDGRLWEAKRKEAVYSVENGKTKIIRNNLTGKVERVNTTLLMLLLSNKYTPVICPPAISFDNQIVNTDNDFATAILAKALEIKKMVVLFEAPGMLTDFPDEKSIIHKINYKKIDHYIQFANGRMKKKLLGAQKAFEMGLETMYWGDGRITNPVLSALAGKGTVIGEI